MKIKHKVNFRNKILIFPLLVFLAITSSLFASDLKYDVEKIKYEFNHPWSSATLPNGDILVTELSGKIKQNENESDTDDAIAVSTIFLNTFLAGAGGVMAAATVTRLNFGKTDVVQMLNGCIGGLVAITAEPLMPSPLAAILIGAVGGVIVVYGTKLLFALKIDDVVGAIPAHLFAGIWGTLAVPITNPDTSFGTQLLGVISINVFVFVVAMIVWSLMKATIGIRLSKEAETKGTDVTETGVIAYAIRD